MSDFDPDNQLSQPVSAFSLDGARLLTGLSHRALELADLDDSAIADLIRRRLRLAKGQGWAVIGTFGATFAGILAIGGMMRSDMLMGLWAAVIASMAVGTAFLLDRGAFRLFRRRSLDYGLSAEACQHLYQRAGDAEAWIAVLEACGQEPNDRDLAGFVLPERRRS